MSSRKLKHEAATFNNGELSRSQTFIIVYHIVALILICDKVYKKHVVFNLLFLYYVLNMKEQEHKHWCVDNVRMK